MRTSVNLRLCDIPKLLDACEKSKRGHSELICLCLRKYFVSREKRLKQSKIYNLVEYQPDGVGYHIVNICFDLDVYNLAVDFRVFCRFSVSMMVTNAIGAYLDEVVCEIEGKKKVSHNYVDLKHVIRHSIEHLYNKWKVEWIIYDTKANKRQKQ